MKTDVSRTRRTLIALLGFVLVGSVAFAVGERMASGESAPVQDVAGAQLVQPPVDGWPTNGGNLYNQRYSPLTRINRDNVANLKGVWQRRLGGSGVGNRYSGEAQPIVDNGVIYVITGADDVFALDVETSETLWTYEANLDPRISTICCGWTSRGVGLGDGKIFVGQLDGKLLALDQQTGEIIWSVQAERWQEGYSITSAPLYYDGMVITGFAGAEFAARGRVKAYDAATGAPVWTFYVVPGPGEFGHETWPQDSDVWKFGGGNVWHTPAVDPELGLLYFSTGNPGPDFNGSVRPGDNLFTTSAVAIDAATGEYRWHYQAVHHDIWDFDLPTPVVLFDIDVDGVSRQAIAATGKTGWVYILDRVTGEPLLGIEERPVPQEPGQATSPTQPYPVGDSFVPQSMDIAPEGYELVNDGQIYTPFLDDGVVMKPSALGGANWPPSSYDPETQLYYVCAQDGIGMFRGGESYSDEPQAGQIFLGGRFGSVSFPTFGIFAALDMKTNTIVWNQRWADSCYSGSVVTRGGLVFVGRNDGRLTALDSSSGERLWEFQTGAGLNATVSIFEHEGEQYVVAYAAGNLFAGSPRGDRVWLFSLNGDMGPAAPPGTRSSTEDAAPGELDAEELFAMGRDVYRESCFFCHGAEGAGGHSMELESPLEQRFVVGVVNQGRYGMPAFGGSLSALEIEAVATYVAQWRQRN